jgi:hypothetical protein
MVFTFQPRWKEILDVSGPGGRFSLELPMGILTACLPTEDQWRGKAPRWAADLWPVLRSELEAWCAQHQAQFEISEDAPVWVED